MGWEEIWPRSRLGRPRVWVTRNGKLLGGVAGNLVPEGPQTGPVASPLGTLETLQPQTLAQYAPPHHPTLLPHLMMDSGCPLPLPQPGLFMSPLLMLCFLFASHLRTEKKNLSSFFM